MNALSIVNKVVSLVSYKMHKTRRSTLFETMGSVYIFRDKSMSQNVL